MINSLSLKEKVYNIKKYKPLLLFLVKAVCIYFGLKYLYLGYVGLADPNGAYDLTEFFGDFNLIMLLTQAYVQVSEVFLNLLGYATTTNGKILLIQGASGVRVEFACLGVELWIALIALLMSYPIPVKDPLKYQIPGVFFGILVIFLFNIIRIVGIVLTNHHSRNMTETIHDIFNYVVYIFIFITFMGWINYFAKKSKVV